MEVYLMNQDDEIILKSFYQDPMIMEKITGYPLSDQEVQDRWKDILSWDHERGYGYFVFYDDCELVGVGCLRPYEEDVEIGYMVDKDHWHQGYGSKICEILLKKVDRMDIRRVIGIIDPNHQYSKKILLNHGFQSVFYRDNEEILEKKKE